MKVFIERENEKVHFLGYTEERKHSVAIDGKEAIGGQDKGMRPAHLLLMSIGSCAVMDFAAMLYKQNIDIEDLVVEVSGERETQGSVSPFVHMTVRFVVIGARSELKTTLQTFAKLAVEQLCSMKASLHPDIRIEHVLVMQ